MTKDQLQEQLTRLYLRLNGFFTTGHIAHSPEPGRVLTEVDVLAVRFPYHLEIERIVCDDPNLQLSNSQIEFAICEVKSWGQNLRFNEALYDSHPAISSVLHRAGIFPSHEISDLIPRVQSLLAPSVRPTPAIPCLEVNATTRIRALLFSPETIKPPRHNQAWFVCGEVMFGYITRCLSPDAPRPSCATNYGAGQWADLEDLVAFFKNRSDEPVASTKELFKYFHAS